MKLLGVEVFEEGKVMTLPDSVDDIEGIQSGEENTGKLRSKDKPESDFKEIQGEAEETAGIPSNDDSTSDDDDEQSQAIADNEQGRLDLYVGPTAEEADDDVTNIEKYTNKHFESDYVPEKIGFVHVGTPPEIVEKLEKVGYECLPHLAVQIGLLLNTPTSKIRALLLEGPSGCGKSYMAKSLAKITGAELMCLSCYQNMPMENLVEAPSTFAMAKAMAGENVSDDDLMNLGILSRAFRQSQEKPVILLIDELDKPDSAIDTFFLGPIQDSRIWLESSDPIDANPENLLIMFTKNFNRKLDDALLRRCHPIKMTYLDSKLERKILSPHCHPQLVANLVSVADRIRNSGGSYEFERPPAPEELLTAGHYVMKLLSWGIKDFSYTGKTVWPIIAKSEHDRAVLEHMMRYHPDFMDPLFPDSKNTPVEEIHARLGRVVLDKIVEDPDAKRREEAWNNNEYM